MKITGRAYREGGFHITGSEQNRAMQNIEGVLYVSLEFVSIRNGHVCQIGIVKIIR